LPYTVNEFHLNTIYFTTTTDWLSWDNNNNNNTDKTVLCFPVLLFYKAIQNFQHNLFGYSTLPFWHQPFLDVLPYILTFFLLYHA
jgi:hypothetical protein